MTTKREACKKWITRDWSKIPSWLITDDAEWYEKWDIIADDEEEWPEFPMWGTLFAPDEWLDEEWIDENREAVIECGFTILENRAMGSLMLGVNGAGYDFYEAHWIPLYEKRGLLWHDED